MRESWTLLVVAGLAAWLVGAEPAVAQNPNPTVRKPTPISTIPRIVPKVESEDSTATPRTPTGVARDPAGGALDASTETDSSITESGPDVTCTITASRDRYEVVPISNNGLTIFAPSEARRVWFHTRRQNLGASTFPTAWAKTRILVKDVVVKEYPGMFNMGSKDCQDCLPVQKSTHAVDLPFWVTTAQVIGTMENDIHNAVAESNESNNVCTVKFTAEVQGTVFDEPPAVY